MHIAQSSFAAGTERASGSAKPGADHPQPAATVKPYTANGMTPAEAIRAEAEAYRGYPDGCVSNGPQTLAGHK